MRGAPVLAKVVATVGIFILLQSIVLLRFGTQNETVRAILPTEAMVEGERVLVAVVRRHHQRNNKSQQRISSRTSS